jgi:hypothetical protein
MNDANFDPHQPEHPKPPQQLRHRSDRAVARIDRPNIEFAQFGPTLLDYFCLLRINHIGKQQVTRKGDAIVNTG